MKVISIDPRVSRMEIPAEQPGAVLQDMDNWQTYEVFHQKKKGDQHIHVGILHAPNAEMALVFAKEQFSRRGQTTSLWVVKSAEVIATSYEDADLFATTPEKLHREPGLYKVREKIDEYRKSKES
jgi:ring-1,2-phenylacetyl-CoA epoxidase subunit PaaB